MSDDRFDFECLGISRNCICHSHRADIGLCVFGHTHIGSAPSPVGCGVCNALWHGPNTDRSPFFTILPSIGVSRIRPGATVTSSTFSLPHRWPPYTKSIEHSTYCVCSSSNRPIASDNDEYASCLRKPKNWCSLFVCNVRRYTVPPPPPHVDGGRKKKIIKKTTKNTESERTIFCSELFILFSMFFLLGYCCLCVFFSFLFHALFAVVVVLVYFVFFFLFFADAVCIHFSRAFSARCRRRRYSLVVHASRISQLMHSHRI